MYHHVLSHHYTHIPVYTVLLYTFIHRYLWHIADYLKFEYVSNDSRNVSTASNTNWYCSCVRDKSVNKIKKLIKIKNCNKMSVSKVHVSDHVDT